MQVHREVIKPVGSGHVPDRGAPAVTDRYGSVVDEDVDATEPILRGLHQSYEIFFSRQVGRDRERFCAKGFDLGNGLTDRAGQLAPVVDRTRRHDDVGAATREGQRRVLSDAPTRACYERHLSRQIQLLLAGPERSERRND